MFVYLRKFSSKLAVNSVSKNIYKYICQNANAYS